MTVADAAAARPIAVRRETRQHDRIPAINAKIQNDALNSAADSSKDHQQHAPLSDNFTVINGRELQTVQGPATEKA